MIKAVGKGAPAMTTCEWMNEQAAFRGEHVTWQESNDRAKMGSWPLLIQMDNLPGSVSLPLWETVKISNTPYALKSILLSWKQKYETPITIKRITKG